MIPGSGRSPGEGIGPTPVFLGFPYGSAGKESACNVGGLGLIPGLRRRPEEGKGCPLQYSGLENSKNCIVHGVTKSRTRWSNFHFHFHSVASDSLQPHGLYSPWNSPGQNTGVGSRSLLQGIFPTQGSNPGLSRCRCILY